MEISKRVIYVMLNTILITVLIFASWAFAESSPMKVRQKSLNLEFKVYRTEDMPANWFKTYDDFYVTKRIDNNWVYGQHTMSGMVMTDILVGTVDPATLPELNEAYTYVPVGATPVYMPPLPPGMGESQALIADIPSSFQQRETISQQETAPMPIHDAIQLPQTKAEIYGDMPEQELIKIAEAGDTTAQINISMNDVRMPSPKQNLNIKEIDVFKFAEYASPQMLRDAVAQGVNFNVVKDSDSAFLEEEFGYGETPLHHAVAHNHNPESIRFLISQGLDVEGGTNAGVSGRFGGTPLFWAIEYKNIEAVRVLLDEGADTNARSASGLPMLTYASLSEKRGQIVDMLIEAGCDVNFHFKNTSKEDAEFVRREISKYGLYGLSTASEAPIVFTRTPLINAVYYDNPDAVNILLDYNADPNIRDLANRNALDYALALPKSSKLKNSPAFERLKKVTKGKP